MAPAPAPNPITEPFPISCIAGRYLLFDVDIIAHCRREHNICGVLIGTIPNLSQQNVFLGVPLELMPEEARVLVERGAAYIVDDAEIHRKQFEGMSREQRLKYMEEMDRKGEEVAKDHQDKTERRKDRALKEKGLRKEVLEKQGEGSVAQSTATDETLQADDSNSGLGFLMKGSAFLDPSAKAKPSKPSTQPKPFKAGQSVASPGLGFIMKGSTFLEPQVEVKQSTADEPATETPAIETPAAETLFESSPVSPSPPVASSTSQPPPVQKHYVTPTTSYPPLPTPSQETSLPLPAVPDSYPLFRYLHSKGYYHMPGLRFGCHYNVYPGDPLRYHSHFAATGMSWDKEFDLVDVVGGGRLGTGTKKAYMIGGEDPEANAQEEGSVSDEKEEKESVRAFSVEWAAI